VANVRCPTCDRLVVNLTTKQGKSYPVWPQSFCRPRLSADVPADYADEYQTAARVLCHSEEASAAISRRLLHRVLSVKTGAGHGSLSDQIRQAVISSDLPPYLKQALQTLTRVAKLDPGSPKSERPEGLTPVEPGEADWLLDVLEAMFDLYFVEPAKMGRRQASLEQKIAPAAQPATTATAPTATTATASDAVPVAAPAATGETATPTTPVAAPPAGGATPAPTMPTTPGA
jgi:hypothetical protein